MNDKIKIVFMGTPAFSVPCLNALISSGYDVKAVFTQPDKPKGRGYKLVPPPVKETALKHDIPVFQPLSLRKGDDAEKAFEILRNIQPDLIIVVAYGQILPENILELPRFGCVNIHASLLPKYRGAAPIQWCIMNGEKVTGITSMLMDAGLDTGDMLLKQETPIGENETASELHDRLSLIGADIMLKTITGLLDNSITPEKQDDSLSCYAPMITKDMCMLDFHEDACTIHNKIRAITGFTSLDGKRLKIFRTEVCDSDGKCYEGCIDDENCFTIVCGDGKCIAVTELQSEGGKRMKADDFIRGKKLEKGKKLG